MRLLALLLSAVLLLSACGDDGTEPLPETPPDGGQDGAGTQPADDELTSIAGTFGADAQLEGGCAWIETDGQRYEVRWPQGYSVDFDADPIALRGPDGAVVAEAGDHVVADGAVNAEMMTICQIGPLFEADSVTADGNAAL